MRPLLAALLLALAAPCARSADPVIPRGSVVVAPLKGEVSKAQFLFLRRALKAAESAGASAFVIDMDTPGGSLEVAVDLLQLLMKARLETITYVNPNAGSAGALIALGTKRIYMAPVAAIGAAAPVMGGGQDIPETMTAKIVSYYSGYFRSAAEKNGYRPELAEAFINRDKEAKIGDTILNPKGQLLTLSAQEAAREIDGRPVLASGIADTVAGLAAEAGFAGHPVVRVEPGGFERVAQWITALAPLFLLGGIIGAYLEFKAPGTAVPGVISAICFALFFLGHTIAGLTGFESVAVFVIGVAFVLLEVLFFPGTLLFGLAGAGLMLGSLLYAMTDFYPGEPGFPRPEIFARPMANLVLALSLAAIAISLMARFMPDLPFFRRLMLGAQNVAGPSIPVPPPTVAGPPLSVGDVGVAITILRPAGKADFGGTPFDVVTEGGFIAAGAALRVAEIRGPLVVVAESLK